MEGVCACVCGCVCGGTLVAIISLMVKNLPYLIIIILASVFKNGGGMVKIVKYIFLVNTSLLYSSHA